MKEVTETGQADVRPSMRVRAAVPADVDVTAQMWRAAWLDGHRGRVPEELLAIRGPEHFADTALAMVDSTLLAVGPAGEVVGVAIIADDELSQFAVDRGARRLGVGSCLIREVEARIAVSHERAWLYVVPGNTVARAFYERHGWRDAGPTIYAAPSASDHVSVPVRRYVKDVR